MSHTLLSKVVAEAGVVCLQLSRGRLKENLSCDLATVLARMLTQFGDASTYSPSSCYACADARADGHWPCSPCALEDSARDGASNNAVGGVVLASQGSNGAVCAVVDHGDDTGAVAQERTSSCHGVENAVQSQPRWHRGRVLLQTFRQAPRATDGQGRQVTDAGSIAEIV